MAITLVLAAVLLAGCSSGTSDGPGAAVPTTKAAGTGRVALVTLGSTDTNGGRREQPLVQTWPQLLYRESFPLRATLVNLARNRSRVTDALQQQVPDALALKPTVAVVWFGTSDAFAGTDPVAYRRDLTEVVDRLTGGGARVVVVLGAAPPGTDIDVARYDDESAAVAAAADVDTVDLRDTPVTPESQMKVADAIAQVLGPIP